MNAVAKYLSFTGQSGCYAEVPLEVLAGASTFTIEIKFSTTSTKSHNNAWEMPTIIGCEIGGNAVNDGAFCVNGGKLCCWFSPEGGSNKDPVPITTNAIVNDGKIHKAAVVSSNGAVDLYCDGTLVAHADNINAKFSTSQVLYFATSYTSSNYAYFQMDLYEARFWSIARTQEQIFTNIDGDESGLEAWYIPDDSAFLKDCSTNGRNATLFGNPNYTFYQTLPLAFTFDLQRIIKTKWRYVNAGNADDLITSSTVLTDLPEDKSITGTAFYQTTRAKCFDIPSTDEIWLKFDVYFNGSNRWRAYNGVSNGTTGICSQTNGNFDFWVNNTGVQSFSGAALKNQLQTILLHMVSGSSDGIVEAWVDGEFVYRYTGDVNHGSDFEDIYLQSDAAGTFFSNVIISNSEIKLGEGYHAISADVQRQVKNIVEVTSDVARNVIRPIIVPFIGEHFNHFVPSVKIFPDKPQAFILPKKSNVYIRGNADLTTYIFSDTDQREQILYHQILAALEPCRVVFIKISTVVSAQQVIKNFMKFLAETELIIGDQWVEDESFGYYNEEVAESNKTLDAAINYSTDGKFKTLSALVESFMTDLNNSESATDFLQSYCDIILDNSDTGAITGSDAGGNITKDAYSVVPEPTDISTWQLPNAETTIINGLTVHWPQVGSNGSDFSDAEKHILAGLNSTWIKQCLNLIEESTGLNFNGENTTVRDLYISFFNNSSKQLAYIETPYQRDDYWFYHLQSLRLRINMRYYNDIDTSNPDGSLDPTSDNYFSAGYLDRTLAHEFTHAVMAANIDTFYFSPAWLVEGSAEIIHGIDDLRTSSIVELLSTRKSELQGILELGAQGDGDTSYCAGYLLLRYLAKQGQHTARSSTVGSLYNLLISDSQSFDNTRQIFYPDLLRSLLKPINLELDLEILNVIHVDFFADLKRALLARLILFPRDSVRLRKNFRNNPVQNTAGLQSFEISLVEQQITDQVSFTGIIPFDIMQQVTGQYLDYHFNMRVERVQQHGILYSCDCCSDIDKLLFTQMAYTIPPMTWYHTVDGETVAESTTVEIETHYPPATEHVKKIARALGLQPVMQFDDFLSTVLMDDLGGVTYNDLIRDVFGWSARIPNKLINVFIRDNQLFVVQRGHELHSIDISDADKTIPIFTRELVRTFWGSNIWSKTNTQEYSLPYFVPPDKVVNSGDDDDDTVREVRTDFSGIDYRGYTVYSYNKKGLLVKTYTYMRKDIGSFGQNTYTTVNHSYDDDGTMIRTDSFTQSMGQDGNSASRSIEQKGYVILPNGEKFLSWEKSETYQNDNGIDISDDDLVDSKVTTHSPSRVGQSHTVAVSTDGDIVGAVVGQNTGDDRVTPFRSKQARQLDNYFDSSSGEWKTKTEEYGQTIYGLSLYDSSFPIHDEASLIKVTKDLKELNRKTKETVNVTVYNLEHLIAFNDTIILNGNSYFLAANTARTTATIKFEQNLTLVRWY